MNQSLSSRRVLSEEQYKDEKLDFEDSDEPKILKVVSQYPFILGYNPMPIQYKYVDLIQGEKPLQIIELPQNETKKIQLDSLNNEEGAKIDLYSLI